MITIRASLLVDMYQSIISPKNVIDIISFSPDIKKKLWRYNLLSDIIEVLNQDEHLNRFSVDQTEKYFDSDREYFIKYLMEHHVKTNGVVKPMSRWNFVSDVNLKKFISTDGNRYEECNEIKISHGTSYSDFIDFMQEYEYKLIKINNALNHVLTIYETNDTFSGISLKRTKWNNNTKGHRFEKLSKDKLRAQGWIINDCKHSKILLADGICLSGTPDGYVEKSPDGNYDNCYIEIKSIPVNKIKQRHSLQIYAYHAIYKSPMILMTKEMGSFNVLVTKYRKKALETNWKTMEEKIIINATRFKNLLSLNDYASYEKLKILMKGKYIKF